MFIRIVLVLLVLSCGVGLAQAEWKEFASSDSDIIYIDPTSHRTDKKSGLVKMWVLYDYKVVQELFGQPHLSMMAQEQYNCQEERWRLLASSYFKGNMGDGGTVFFQSTEGPWLPVPNATIGESLWKLVCRGAKP